MKILLILLFIATNVNAGEVTYVEPDGYTNKQTIVYDDELSHKIFTNWDFRDRPEYDFTNKTIYNTTFTQEKPNSVIFKDGTENVTFVMCKLHNVVLPPGSIIIAPTCDGIPCWTEAIE